MKNFIFFFLLVLGFGTTFAVPPVQAINDDSQVYLNSGDEIISCHAVILTTTEHFTDVGVAVNTTNNTGNARALSIMVNDDKVHTPVVVNTISTGNFHTTTAIGLVNEKVVSTNGVMADKQSKCRVNANVCSMMDGKNFQSSEANRGPLRETDFEINAISQNFNGCMILADKKEVNYFQSRV